MEKRDYYDLLGIGPNATEIEIKKAYRALAIKYHPDKNQGDSGSEPFFKEITEAYKVILNPQERALYDQFGHSLAPTRTRHEEEIDLVSALFNTASDFVDQFLGGKHDRKFRVIRGYDLKYNLDLSFRDAALGKDMPISYKRLQTCDSCKGTGALAGTRPVICPKCRGRGDERVGLLSRSCCIECNGEGRVIPNPCPECQGEGRVHKQRTLTVTIPPGAEHGDIIRIQSEGEAGENIGPYGDLYVVIRIKKHPRFQKVKNDVLAEVSIGLSEAASGCEVMIPTLTGKRLLKIPPATQPDEIISLKGEGIASANSKRRGDMLVRIRVRATSGLKGKKS